MQSAASQPLVAASECRVSSSRTLSYGRTSIREGACMTLHDADTFTLYNLRVEVIATDRPMVCSHRAGDSFELSGEDISFPPGQTFPLYPLAALLPILPAKQRLTDPNDWMTTDTDVACPDPHCGARFRITRTGRRTFRHSDVTVVPR